MTGEKTLEDLGHNVSRETLHNGQIILFYTGTPKRESVDTYVNNLLRLFSECVSEGKLCLYAFIGNEDAALNDYARTRLESATKSYPNLHGRAAFVLPRNPASIAIKRFVEQAENKLQPYMKRRVFYHREEAIAWLEEALEQG